MYPYELYFVVGAFVLVVVVCVLSYLWGWTLGKRHPDFDQVVEHLDAQLELRRAEDKVLKMVITKAEAMRAGSEPRK